MRTPPRVTIFFALAALVAVNWEFVAFDFAVDHQGQVEG